MSAPAIDAFVRTLHRIGGTQVDEDTFSLSDGSLSVQVGRDSARITGGANQPAMEQSVVSLARLFNLRVLLDRDADLPQAQIKEIEPATRATPAVITPARHVRRACGPLDEAFRRIPDLQRLAIDRGRVEFAQGIAAELQGSDRTLTMHTNELPESARTALALLVVQVVNVCDRTGSWLRIVPRDVPVWLHKTFRAERLSPENGGSSYLRAPRPTS